MKIGPLGVMLLTSKSIFRGWMLRRKKRSFILSTKSISKSIGSSLIEDFDNHPGVKESAPSRLNPSKPYFPIFYNDLYEVKLPKGHRFPMNKYRQVRERIQQSIDIESGISQFCVSPLATWEELITTHSPEYVSRFLQGNQTVQELRNVGFPWSPDGVKRSLSSTGGTIAAACAICEALASQKRSSNAYPIWSAHVAGGTHHAFFDRGEGFCIFSDIAVAANVIQRKYSFMRRILIIDLDVHQGNGNAVLFQGRQDVVTFSLHCEGNYFSPKESSDLDVELPIGCSDETYLATLRHWLNQIKNKGGHFDLVFFQAGVDGLKQDRLGRMDLTAEGLSTRNKLVFDFCSEQRLPLVITMGGGYPRDEWKSILNAHANVYIQAHEYLWDLWHG
mmetsp:Transcript_26396/g.39011  ORF Transcript_26396/g.39011 Transcript_26396/m.39011 type:complete len:390 (+) Transcript_26396:128-1297(+)|eukprot:CAMPEP_0194220782 /NCGR_PEP_ID=MMETSP0156-20130528/29209_1 /TAXON_ID=33649 /ORGANISM="Thalassionema nitzschioides, Strain L26-B" /LENGTH=389 /DNA_ID=CAMNT_0038950967 /DNA_START=61 /DNA_END=1230 /DNA_ORIENTATION=+